MSIERPLQIVIEYLARRPGVRSRLEEQVNSGLKAQSLEQDRSTGQVRDIRCDQHERPIWKCHEKHLPCEAGKSLHTDRTGEAGTSTDPARRMLMDLDRAENALLTDANRLIGHPMASNATLAQVLVRHGYLISGTVRKSARVFDRALGEVLGRHRPDPGKSADGLPQCGSCERYKVNGVPLYSDPSYNKGNPTNLRGDLDRPVLLCDSCYRHAKKFNPNRLPTVKEIQHREERGSWPNVHATMKRAS